jgi:hypothetical protein
MVKEINVNKKELDRMAKKLEEIRKMPRTNEAYYSPEPNSNSVATDIGKISFAEYKVLHNITEN